MVLVKSEDGVEGLRNVGFGICGGKCCGEDHLFCVCRKMRHVEKGSVRQNKLFHHMHACPPVPRGGIMVTA